MNINYTNYYEYDQIITINISIYGNDNTNEYNVRTMFHFHLCIVALSKMFHGLGYCFLYKSPHTVCSITKIKVLQGLPYWDHHRGGHRYYLLM